MAGALLSQDQATQTINRSTICIAQLLCKHRAFPPAKTLRGNVREAALFMRASPPPRFARPRVCLAHSKPRFSSTIKCSTAVFSAAQFLFKSTCRYLNDHSRTIAFCSIHALSSNQSAAQPRYHCRSDNAYICFVFALRLASCSGCGTSCWTHDFIRCRGFSCALLS